MWRGQLVAWHVVYAVIWLVAGALVLIEPAGRHGRLALILALLAMALNYLFLGTRALEHGPSGWAIGYHILGWGLLCLGMVIDPEAELWLFLWVLFPHLWAMLGRRAAIVGTTGAMLAVGLTQWSIVEFDQGAVGQILVTFIGSVGLSLAVGLFIDRLVREAETRAETIDELNATRAQLAAAERDRGVAGERERLSREIHDTLAQGFTSVLALTRAADAALARGDVDTARARLALVESTAVDNLKEARLIVAELTPGHLESRTLAEALERLVFTVRESGGMTVALSVTGAPVALGGAKEIVVLRSAQEALANVRRHAAASGVDVVLSYAGESVTLTVTDDGVGFDEGRGRVGYGIDGLRARAAEVGGDLDLTSAPGHGTTLTVRLPLATTNRADDDLGRRPATPGRRGQLTSAAEAVTT